jgi:hypothetical protein
MSLGLVSLEPRLKLLAAFWLPERRLAVPRVAKHLVVLRVHDPDVGAVGGITLDDVTQPDGKRGVVSAIFTLSGASDEVEPQSGR